jgi:DNA invertase Pin-like site-specific DNA recombinase
MKAIATNLSKNNKTPKDILFQQLSLALAEYEHAERGERVRQGIARRKALDDSKRNKYRTS